MVISACIDRYEEDKVVLLVGEDEDEQLVMPQSVFPTELDEGDYVRIEITRDDEKTQAALDEARELMRQINEDNA